MGKTFIVWVSRRLLYLDALGVLLIKRAYVESIGGIDLSPGRDERRRVLEAEETTEEYEARSKTQRVVPPSDIQVNEQSLYFILVQTL